MSEPGAIEVGPASNGRLDLARQFDGARLVVVGGTGFLGKVWLALLLHRFPMIGKVYLVVRAKTGKNSEERFWSEIAYAKPLEALRNAHPDDYADFLREKVVAIDADVSKQLCGFDPALVRELSGTIDAVVNVAGVVDFYPPLDEALLANAFGVQNLVDLARALGDVPVLHTSTCYVAGYRTGHIDERDPREQPFPKYPDLEAVHWDPKREIDECLDIIAQARHRADDAFRENAFLDTARKNLAAKGEPARGSALADEVKKVRRRFIEQKLTDAGTERALYWGWTNIYTYTKSLGEQILAGSGLPFTIVRPAVIESSMSYPFAGWNEGINTMAPLMFLWLKGHVQVPIGERTSLDVIPVDMVSGGMILALGALLEGTAKPVYQLGSSDLNALTMRRLVDLSGLYKRKYYQRSGKGNPWANFVQAHIEPVPVSRDAFYKHGAPAIAKGARALAAALRGAAVGPTANVLVPAAKALEGYSDLAKRNGEIWEMFLPFMAETEYYFDCANTRELRDRLSEEDRAATLWYPEKIDWRHYLHDVQLPGLEKWVIPEIEEKLNKPKRPLRTHDSLLDLLEEAAAQHDLSVALQRFEQDGLTRVTFRDWRDRAEAAAGRLAALGVLPGDKVFLSGANHPDWPIAYFGILRAGAIAVPVDPALEAGPMANVLRASGARLAVFDAKTLEGAGQRALQAVEGTSAVLYGELTSLDGAPPAPAGITATHATIASVIYTSGTTGTPKGVLLSHGNFVSLLAALAPVFPLKSGDRAVSVLPLHHTFEFTCGMLLPLSRGARVIYLDELTGERLSAAMREARVTAMVGVPALWQMLERRIVSQARAKGPAQSALFDAALSLNQLLTRKVGANVGKMLFGEVHDRLGGNIRLLISGGAALPKETAKMFEGLGLPLTEGYGLTEASPVLTVNEAGGKGKVGTVGKAIPGVQVKIASPDASGVGEVLAKGPNVMLGYADDPEATRQALDDDGWLHTGDLGKIDDKGRLTIVGRSKDVIVGVNGENVYPDDVEKALGEITGITEVAIVGVPDPRGGERVACVAVPSGASENETAKERLARRDRALRNLREALAKLPRGQQPAVTLLYDAELPRTATRKVKRTEVRAILERLSEASGGASTGAKRSVAPSSAVRTALAALTKKKPEEITESTKLRGDLHLDSLMAMELSVALEAALGRPVSESALNAETVGDLEALLGAEAETALVETSSGEGAKSAGGSSKKRGIDEGEREDPPQLPEALKDVAKAAVGFFQHEFYGTVMNPKVTGRANIPHNRNTLVVANHASHLDMGLVKFALGSYGRELVSLAARDYFWEAKRWRRVIVENFTNLAPMDRSANLRTALREVGSLLDEGKTVLLFPEGTRSPDGQIKEFKGAVGHLALHHNIDLLPVFVSGTFEAMPRSTKFPTRRDVSAKIGPPLEIEHLRRLVSHLRPAEQARAVAKIAQRAVEALRDGGALDLRRVKSLEALDGPTRHPMVALFEELPGRFVKGVVSAPMSFYFTLGVDAESKWTVRVDAEQCEIVNGKPDGGVADCVLKTSAEMFTRIVREGYVPGVPEFVSGAVKSNDVSLLETFTKVFALG